MCRDSKGRSWQWWGVTSRAAGARLVWLEKKSLQVINQSINQSYLASSPEIREKFEVILLESEPPGLVEVTLPMAEGGMR